MYSMILTLYLTSKIFWLKVNGYLIVSNFLPSHYMYFKNLCALSALILLQDLTNDTISKFN